MRIHLLFRPLSARVLLALMLMLCVGSLSESGCTSCLPRSDAERAKEERQQVHDQLNSSLLVLPYRGMKTVTRASALQPPPPQIAEVIRLQNEASKALLIEQTDLVGQSQQIVALVSAMYRSGAILFREEEDRYPLLWQVAHAGPHPAAWYDAPSEHLFVGLLDLFLYVAGKQKPLIDWVYYELERAQPQPSWPQGMRLLAQQVRGLMFIAGEKHYAAEEELSGYLQTLLSMAPADIAQLEVSSQGKVSVSGADYHKGLRAAGHLTRSFNRFALKRDARGYEDLEAALGLIEQLGVHNELTDWAALSLALHKKDYTQAARHLDSLAQSPYLSDDERAEVKACAASMARLDEGFVLFGRQRALLTVSRAAFARIGGIKTVLATLAILIGPDRTLQVTQTALVLWSVGSVLAQDAESKSKEALEQGKELGHKGYELIQRQVDKLRQ